METYFSNINQIANAIGWTLIHFVWQGTIIFFAYIFITKLLLKRNRELHYLIGMFFMVVCLVVPLMELGKQLAVLSLPSTQSFFKISNFNSSFIQNSGILNPYDLLILLIQKAIPYIVLIWLISVSYISFRMIKSWINLAKICKINSAPIPSYLTNHLNRSINILKIRFKPVLVLCNAIDVPATFGYFKPVILLPLSLLNNLPQDQVESIVLHELCHIKRADFLYNIIQIIVETLFFYHPFIRYISNDIRKNREHCCDEKVLQLKANPLVYAKALTNIASFYNRSDKQSNLHIAANDGELFQRIKDLMSERKSNSKISHFSANLFIILITLIILSTISTNEIYKNKAYVSINSRSNSNNIKEHFRESYKFLGIQFNRGNVNKETHKNKKITEQKPTPRLIKKVEKAPIKIHSKLKTIEKPKPKSPNNAKNIYKEIYEKIDKTTPDKISFTHPKSRVVVEFNTNLKKTTVSYSNKLNQLSSDPTSNNIFPTPVIKVYPDYGLRHKRAGLEGSVLLSFNIDTNGEVQNIIIDNSSNNRTLDSLAKTALNKWHFNRNTITKNHLSQRFQQKFEFKINI